MHRGVLNARQQTAQSAAVRGNVSDTTNTRKSHLCYQLCEGQEYITAEM